MRPADLDADQYLILLREKGETVRWQPVSPTLMGKVAEHAQARHALPDGQLLRYADGRPITSRRYDHLWTRLGRQLPWVRTQQVSAHWIRHTILTWVDLGVRYVLQSERMGHEVPGMRGVYSHITASMREELRTGLERLWVASLAERARLAERSAISVLDDLLAAR